MKNDVVQAVSEQLKGYTASADAERQRQHELKMEAIRMRNAERLARIDERKTIATEKIRSAAEVKLETVRGKNVAIKELSEGANNLTTSTGKAVEATGRGVEEIAKSTGKTLETLGDGTSKAIEAVGEGIGDNTVEIAKVAAVAINPTSAPAMAQLDGVKSNFAGDIESDGKQVKKLNAFN